MSSENLSLKERLEFAKTVSHGRKDPVWFLKDIIGWTSIFPMQEEIVRRFYQNKYDPSLQKYKKLIARCGQRCLSGDSHVYTNHGLIQIKDLYTNNDDVQVYNGNAWVSPSEVIFAGKKSLFKITTEYGFSIECSEDHKFYTYNGRKLEWKSLKDIKIGEDCLQVVKGLHCSGTDQISDKMWRDFKAFTNQNKTKYILPDKITPELASVMGMLIADGDIANKGKIRFTKGDRSLIDFYVNGMKHQFNLNCNEYYKEGNTQSIEIYSEVVRHFLYCVGLDFTISSTKHIPHCILNGTKEIQVAFLSGYFSCDGNVQESKSGKSKKCRVTSTTVSKQLAFELQGMLLGLGIISSISISKSVEFGSRIKRDNDAFTLNIFGKEILAFYDNIKLISTTKQEKFNSVYLSQKSKRVKGRYLPICKDLLHECFEYHSSLRHMWKKDSKEFLIDKHKDLYNGGSDIVDQLIKEDNIFVMVKSIQDLDACIDMYDLHVPEGNCYVANGFLTHNSGKTVLGSKIAIYEFFELVSLDNPAEYYGLIKNQEIAINCIAAGKEQALEGMFSLMRNDIEENEWFNQWFDLKITEGKITCDKKHVYAKVAAARADSGSGTGTTSKLSLLDEVDLFQRTDSKVGSEVVISKALNATKTLGLDGKFVAISSTQFTDGAITKLYMDGQNETDTLVYNLPTWIMNPKFTKETLMEEYRYKMHMFWRDFANQPEVSGGLMFPNGVKFNKNIPNVFFADEQIVDEYAQHYHVISLDPAFRNDAFGIACGYVDGNNIVIDGARKYTKEHETEAFIKPSDMENEIERWVERLNVTTLLFDADIILNIVEKAQDQWGITTIKNIVGEKEYGMWLSLNDGIGEYNLDITYDEYAKREAEQLVKSQLPSGKIRVDHPFSGSKDVADSICQTIYFLSQNNTGNTWNPIGHLAAMR